ncbi:hypothetical protein EKE94_12435 [Mesobaculum littorinae]|uniref:Uncharacterized protein n=1 Tax=Mesobaculum littorinae TaxID=2486419 RepID=A0A438AFI2_9RHOB|nr:hypothetical protein [Mesobaculum littorinae]RVV97367.1 hypothetical protein EKE94_12435 [Mesobaculum littorinae]
MSVPKKYDDIDFTPPAAAADAAEKGLELRRKFGRGGTDVGVARARDLKNRKTVSPDTVERMVNYFARHEVDKRAGNFGDDDDPSAGYIAWLLWGGDPGREWADGVADKMEKADAAAS